MRALALLLPFALVLAGCATPDDGLETASVDDSALMLEEELGGLDPTEFAKFSVEWLVGVKSPPIPMVQGCEGAFVRMSADGGGIGYANLVAKGKAGNAFLTVFVDSASTADVAFTVCAYQNNVVVREATGKAPFATTFEHDDRATAAIYIVPTSEAATANVNIDGRLMWTPTDPREGNVTSAE